jgi:lipopolysaccharide export LptBFGC system permease protein LptF
VERNQLLWVLVVFFGASVVFAGLRRLTEGESAAVVAGVQVAALAAIVIGLVVFVRRRR